VASKKVFRALGAGETTGRCWGSRGTTADPDRFGEGDRHQTGDARRSRNASAGNPSSTRSRRPHRRQKKKKSGVLEFSASSGPWDAIQKAAQPPAWGGGGDIHFRTFLVCSAVPEGPTHLFSTRRCPICSVNVLRAFHRFPGPGAVRGAGGTIMLSTSGIGLRRKLEEQNRGGLGCRRSRKARQRSCRIIGAGRQPRTNNGGRAGAGKSDRPARACPPPTNEATASGRLLVARCGNQQNFDRAII